MNICQNCKNYRRPMCYLKDEFVARKTEGCSDFQINKNKKINIVAEVKEIKKETDEEIVNKVFNCADIKEYEHQKMSRSKTHKRK